MKKSYIINIKEVTTCNGCLFARWDDYGCKFHCSLINENIDGHMYSKTKHKECPLILA